MAVTKTNFLNYSRCPRYVALAEIKKERLDAEVSYKDYVKQELKLKVNEILNFMYEDDDDGEIDLIDETNKQLEAMLKYYNKIEQLAGDFVSKKFGGVTIYSEFTNRQERFEFSSNGIKYLCYVDIYNENGKDKKLVEVKATTTNKFLKLAYTENKEKETIFEYVDNILYLKEDLRGHIVQNEDKYYKQRIKLLDRYSDVGRYVYDLAVQRYIVEGQYKKNDLENFSYYLGVLNHEYTFDGTYENDEPVYKTDENGNELITLIDLTRITKELQPIIEQDKKRIENYLLELDATPRPLGKSCEFKKQTVCKFFDKICGSKIPKTNSSLNYLDNGHGFETGRDRVKGLELINDGYLNMLDIPEDWITRPNHHIQRNCLRTEEPHIDKEKIKEMLNMIEYPIYHLDFETFPCPLPRFRGEKPYYQSPFEFSLHIETEPGVCDENKDNYVFLAKSFKDEREDLIKELLKYVNPNKGTLLAQNVAFEKSRLKELAEIFPNYKSDLMKIVNRNIDLIWLLKTKAEIYIDLGYDEERAKRVNYYDYRFSGSYSIKKTLPVFSKLNYDALEISNGTDALITYSNYPNMSKSEFDIKYKALVEYCKQDTWAMVVILNELRKSVKELSKNA